MNSTTIIHHDFEMSPEEFEAKKAWQIKGTKDWKGEYASQSPLNQMRVVRDGKGAEGTSGWLALEGTNSDQFYAEETPRWYRPRQAFDRSEEHTSELQSPYVISYAVLCL